MCLLAMALCRGAADGQCALVVIVFKVKLPVPRRRRRRRRRRRHGRAGGGGRRCVGVVSVYSQQQLATAALSGLVRI